MRRIVLAIAAVVTLAVAGYALQAQAYSCNTTCTGSGGFRTCNTYCF